jgi:hypothetical protein
MTRLTDLAAHERELIFAKAPCVYAREGEKEKERDRASVEGEIEKK